MDDPFLTVAIAVTLWGSVGGLALVHRPNALVEPYRRVGLLVRVVILDLVIIPPAAWAITRLLAVPDEYAIGLILVGATAAGPLGVVAVQLARGDTILALALVTLLEVANAIAVPAWAIVLLPRSAAIPLGIVAATLAAYVLAPLVAGTLIRLRAPGLAARLVPVARVAAVGGLCSAVILVVAGNAPTFVAAAEGGVPLATGLLIVVALAGGWLTGGPGRRSRIAVALVTAQRGSSVALGIAVAAFAETPEAAVAVVVFGMISVVVVPAVGLAVRGPVADTGGIVRA